MTVGDIGCGQHRLDAGDASYFCYVAAGSVCDSATASELHPGAAWRPCSIEPRASNAQSRGSQRKAAAAAARAQRQSGNATASVKDANSSFASSFKLPALMQQSALGVNVTTEMRAGVQLAANATHTPGGRSGTR